MIRVAVYDSDGVNPYGRELAHLLRSAGAEVSLYTACDVEWLPEVATRRILPGNRGGSPRWLQAIRLLHGVTAVLIRVLLFQDRLIVVWPRSALEELAFAGVSRLGGKVAVVLHDPVDRGAQSRFRSWTRARYARMAWRRVAHSPRLAGQFAEQLATDVTVCEFPPHSAWIQFMPGPATSTRAEGITRFLMLGQVRPDKGYGEIAHIVRALPAEIRERAELSICGRGQLDQSLMTDLSGSISVLDETSTEFVPDASIKAAIFQSDVLLAPYVGASQSSTVAMALAAGLGVVAYDVGAIADLVCDEWLVPAGDAIGFASRMAAAARDAAQASRRDLTTWRAEATTSWLRLWA
jgi:glycosyltransferase involved in cell wall biosynthesis